MAMDGAHNSMIYKYRLIICYLLKKNVGKNQSSTLIKTGRAAKKMFANDWLLQIVLKKCPF